MMTFFAGMILVFILCMMLAIRAGITAWKDHQRGEPNWGAIAAGGIPFAIAIMAAILAGLAYNEAMRAL